MIPSDPSEPREDTPDRSADAFARVMEAHRQDPSLRATQKPDDYAGRPLGLALLALGSLLFYTETWLTIVAARAHHPIQYFGKGVYVQPLFVVLGLIYTVFGAHASRVLGPTRHPSRWGVALMVVLIACCFAYLFAVERYLRTLGYAV